MGINVLNWDKTYLMELAEKFTESPLFVGEFHRSVDDKGRLTIPSSWRPQNVDNLIFLGLPTPDGNISVYPPKMVAQLEARISQISIGDIDGQKAITELMSLAFSFNLDKQGRINLNDKLLNFAGIRKEVILIGKLSTFSLFSNEGFEKFQSSYSKDANTKAEVFQRFGL